MLVMRGLDQLVLAAGTNVSLTGVTVQTAVVTVPIPAGRLRVGDALECKLVVSMPNNANNKSFRVRLNTDGGATTGTAFFDATFPNLVASNNACWIRMRAASSEVGAFNQLSGAGGANSPVATAAIDFSAPVYVVFTIQNGSAADTSILESYSVAWIPGS